MARALNLMGSVYVLPEAKLEAVTGVSGSGPAYIFLTIEAMADGGVKMGLPRKVALDLAARTVIGAGEMVLRTGKHPGVLKDEVCSPGGATIEAMHELEEAGVRGTFMAAVEASHDKAAELRMIAETKKAEKEMEESEA